MRQAESLEYTGHGRNIFSQFSAPPAIPKPIAPIRQAHVDTGPPPPPPPPPINLGFYGYAAEKTGQKQVFLLQGDDIFIASEGDVVDRRYRVVKIGARLRPSRRHSVPQHANATASPVRAMMKPNSSTIRLSDTKMAFCCSAFLFMILLIMIALAIAAPKMAESIRRDKEEETIHRGKQYARAIQMYYTKYGRYPNTHRPADEDEQSAFPAQALSRSDDRQGRLAHHPQWRAEGTDHGLVRPGSAAERDHSYRADHRALVPEPRARLDLRHRLDRPGSSGGTLGSGGSSLGSSSGSGFGSSGSSFGSGSSTSPFGANSGSGFGNSGSSTSPIGGTDSSSGSGFGSSSWNRGNRRPLAPAERPVRTISVACKRPGAAAAALVHRGQRSGGAPIVGVGLLDKRTSIKVYRKQTHYNQWEFVFDPNQSIMDAAGLARRQGQWQHGRHWGEW